jgi:hypothetical protein
MRQRKQRLTEGTQDKWMWAVEGDPWNTYEAVSGTFELKIRVAAEYKIGTTIGPLQAANEEMLDELQAAVRSLDVVEKNKLVASVSVIDKPTMPWIAPGRRSIAIFTDARMEFELEDDAGEDGDFDDAWYDVWKDIQKILTKELPSFNEADWTEVRNLGD